MNPPPLGVNLPHEVVAFPLGTSPQVTQIILEAQEEYEIRQRRAQREHFESQFQSREEIDTIIEMYRTRTQSTLALAMALNIQAELPARPKKRSFFGLRMKDGVAWEECLACVTEFESKKMVELPCSHKYCLACFEHLVESNLNDTAFPPKCCAQAVPSTLVAERASRAVRKAYKITEHNMSVPLERRWYCPYPSCERVVDKDFQKIWSHNYQRYACPKCFRSVCQRCNQPAHRKHSCPDYDNEAVMEEVNRRGWRPCKKCGRIIELTSGCRHMTCNCRYQFCWTCNRPWGKCADNHLCAISHEGARRTGWIPAPTGQANTAAQPVPATDDPMTMLFRRPSFTTAILQARATRIANEEAEIAAQVAAIDAAEAAADIEAVERFEREQTQQQNEAAWHRETELRTSFNRYRAELEDVHRYQEVLVRSRHDFHRNTIATPANMELEALRWTWAQSLQILAQDEEMVRTAELPLSTYRESAVTSAAVTRMLSPPPYSPLRPLVVAGCEHCSYPHSCNGAVVSG